MKGYAKNSNNRMNLSYSIAKKAQYNFADRLSNSRGLEDIIETKCMPGSIKGKVYVHMWSKEGRNNDYFIPEVAQKKTV